MAPNAARAEKDHLWMGTNLILGLGFALFSSPNMSAIMGSVEKKHYGSASGAMATMRLFGQMTSMAVVTLLLAIFLGERPIGPSTYRLFLKCVQTCFIICTLLCIMGIYFSLSRGKIQQEERTHQTVRGGL